MSQPYVGEIRLFAGNFAPAGWLLCNGALLPISDYDTLFNLIGTTYGGDGQTTFAVPNLQGRMPVHQGSNHVIGEAGGVEAVSLTPTQIPAHNHGLSGSSAIASTTSPAGGLPASLAEVTTFAYGSDLPLTTLHPQSVSPAGGNQPHENMSPYLVLTFIISAFGIYPSPT